MGNPASVVEETLQAAPQLRPQLYFKTSLTALSHAMEDQVLAGLERPLVIASFQQERFYRQEANRYLRIAELTDQVYVLSAKGTSFNNCSDAYETIAFEEDDALVQEWHLVVIGSTYSACLVCRERSPAPMVSRSSGPALEQTRRFEGIWTQDRHVSQRAADLLLERIQQYRPELVDKIALARATYLGDALSADISPPDNATADPFSQRLVTYLQAGQYKLLKAYKAIANQEQRGRLVNSISAAIRQSLNPHEIFEVAVQELGQALGVCRCLIYRWGGEARSVQVEHQHFKSGVESLVGASWPLDTPLFDYVRASREMVAIADVQDRESPFRKELEAVQTLMERWQIRSWLIAPLIYQERLLGVIELHHCQSDPYAWSENDQALVDAISTPLSVAIIQAESYANLEVLNHQLAALDLARSNLIAITGHELRTPLSTIQVCLESLATEPDMPQELRQVMLNSALEDADRMRKLVQDFLTLSRLESGRIDWNLEALSLQECIDLALSSIHTRQGNSACGRITVKVPKQAPLVRADGEWLVEVLVKLLDNACKFTLSEDTISIEVSRYNESMMQVTVADTGRGIEPNRLEAVFDRFYQEEGALRRTTGGTGLGLAMCRQIVAGLGGDIWATSGGKDQGSAFHFTLPVAQSSLDDNHQTPISPTTARSLRNRYRNSESLLLDERIG